MFWQNWRWLQRSDDSTPLFCVASEDLVSDCEAFLLGRAAERLSARRAPVPAWAWVNALAHGSADEIRGLARLPGGKQPRGFIAEMARDMLERFDSGEMDLRAFQQDTLIPLELSLVSSRWSCVPRSGHDLRNAICAAMAAGPQPVWSDRHTG